MSKYIIHGGKSLAGDVVINGAKNAALGIVAASIMSDEMVTIENLPDVWDINVLLDAIKEKTGFDCNGKSEEEIRAFCKGKWAL